jgi:Ni,Fe-hydrogenase maturation factor
MKKEEVPQDGNNMHEGTFKQLFYATDNVGQYVPVTSVGWEPENVAMQQAWEEINERVEKARAQVLAGEVSPVVYYMEKTIMDLPLLASYVGKFQWQIKRHMKPAVFNKLSDKMLRKYAAAFKISVQELKNIR